MTKTFFCRFFFGLVRLFFANCLNVSKRSPFIFSYFAKEWMFKNSQRPPFLHFSALCDLPETKKISKKIWKNVQKNRFFFQFFSYAGTVEENTWNIEVLLRFLSLRYSADLGRSRLVIIYSTFLFQCWCSAFPYHKIIQSQDLCKILPKTVPRSWEDIHCGSTRVPLKELRTYLETFLKTFEKTSSSCPE